MLDNKIKELTEDVLYKIQKHYVDQGIQLRFSLFALIQWNAYHMKIFYYFDGKDYFFFLKFDEKKSQLYQLLKPNFFPAFIILSKKFISNEYVHKLKLLINNKDCKIFLSEELDKLLVDENNLKSFDQYPPKIGNYIYETKSFINFSGKKMQKKRNHLNSFFKDNKNFTIEKIDEKNLKEAIKFIEDRSDGRNYEINSYESTYKNILKHPDIINGSILKVNNKIIGATIGIINGDFYEIIIEKAILECRGSYQVLISENLKLNKIKTKFIDRQDDLDNENLIKSKESYHPIEKVMFMAYKI